MQALEHTHDLYTSSLYGVEQQITTDYEQKFRAQGKKICYLRFTFNPQAPPVAEAKPLGFPEPAEQTRLSSFDLRRE